MLATLVTFAWWNWLATPLHHLLIDLYPTYVAGRLWMQGHFDAIYQLDNFIEASTAHPRWMQELRVLGLQNFGSSFVYSPIYLWMMTPLVSALSLPRFVQLFFVLNAVSAVVLGSESARLAGIRRLDLRLLTGALAAFTFPVLYGAQLGQNLLPAAAIVLLAFRALESPRAWPLGAVLLLLAIGFKPWLVVVVPLLGLVGWWRAFAVTAIGYGAIYLLLPNLVARGLTAMYQEMAGRLVSMSIVAHNNVSIRATLHRLVWPGWEEGISVWVPWRVPTSVQVAEIGILVLLAGAFLAIVWRRRPQGSVVLCAGLALVVPCLGVSWTHYLALLIPVGVMGLLADGMRPATRVLSGVLLLGLFVPLHPLALRTLPTPESVAAAPTFWLVSYAVPPALAVATAIAVLLGVPRGAARGADA